MATAKIAYASSAALTLTLASLGSSATAARCSTAVDNSSNLYDDVLVTLGIKSGSGTMANDKNVYVFAYGSEDGTNYDAEETGTLGSDAAYTMNAPTNHVLVGSIYVPTAAKVYTKVFSIAQAFGGIMPRKWGLIVRNYSGQSLDSTEENHIKSYTGITYTVA